MPSLLQRLRAKRFFELLQVVVIFPAVIVGIVLPLDFLYQIDGYRMYLSPLAIVHLFTFTTVIYLFLALVLTLPLVMLAWLIARFTRWPHITVLGTIFVGISTAAFVLILISGMQLWVQQLDVVRIAMPRYRWVLLSVISLCMLAAYQKPNKLTGILRWAKMSSMLVMSFAAISYLIIGVLTYTGGRETTTGSLAPIHASYTKIPPRPNIVFVTIDAFSARHSPLYGYPRDTTPALQQLAREASTFVEFYANSNSTVPGVNSFIYGVRPWTHRAFAFGAPFRSRFNLVAQLKQADYTTLAITSNPNASPVRSLTKQYFDASVDCAIRITFSDCLLFQVAPTAAIPMSQLHFVSGWLGALDIATVGLGIWSSADHHDPELVLSQARQMLMKWRFNAPFFLWVHLMPPHDPYASPEPFIGHFDASALRRTRFDSSPPSQFSAGHDPMFPNAYLGRYDESLLYVDYHVGRFFDWLKQNQLYEGSLIVLTADHGESFSRGYGTHGGPLLHNDLIHIPLLIKQPHQTQGQRINAVAEQIDLVPTILDLASISAQGSLEGKSLKPILQGEVQRLDRPIFSMTLELNSRFGPLHEGTVAMIDGSWKYVHYRGYVPSASQPALHDELYKLDADPDEKRNLISQHPDIAATMKAAIETQFQLHSRPRE